MAFESLISSAGRLQILTALAEETPQDFVTLRSRTQMTDGNLSTHARRLATAGLVNVRKAIRDARPVTTLELTLDGRQALERHVDRLQTALSRSRTSNVAAEARQPVLALIDSTETAAFASTDPADDWVD